MTPVATIARRDWLLVRALDVMRATAMLMPTSRAPNLARANLADANLAEVIALGYPNGWPAWAQMRDGQLTFRVGCRTKTLAEARAYWTGKDDRREVMAAIDYAETVARLRGWLEAVS